MNLLNKDSQGNVQGKKNIYCTEVLETKLCVCQSIQRCTSQRVKLITCKLKKNQYQDPWME